ncbi:MAG: tRNA lysidine(34) synthetase TilS [Chloroflexi bacterium]|nr:tRNA lysidine(34) synthetase TilS [Chloroflexota bacterium]
MLDLVRKSLLDAGFDRRCLLVVGLSGGPDSLALTHALKQLNYQIHVGHFDHALRPSSAQDAERVRQMCAEWGLPFHADRQLTTEFALENKMSVEEAARALRYRFLFEVANRLRAAAVVVAHTADDQVETVLMHMLRGAGSEGLAGMRPRIVIPQWSDSIPLARPLLAVWRADIEEYCRVHGLEPMDDETNRDERWARNRIRHQLIPGLATYNPQIKTTILKLSQVLRGEDDFLAEIAVQRSKVISTPLPEGGVVVQRGRFLLESLAVRRRLVRHWCKQAAPDVELGYDQIARLLEWAEADAAPACLEFGDEIWGLRTGNEFRIGRVGVPLFGPGEFPQLEQDCIKLKEPGNYSLNSHWALELSLAAVAKELDSSDNPDLGKLEIRLTPDLLAGGGLTVGELTARKRMLGERLRPFGMGGHSVLLSDLFINHKVLAPLRDNWPVICLGDRVIWVPMLRASEEGHGASGAPFFRLRLVRIGE